MSTIAIFSAVSFFLTILLASPLRMARVEHFFGYASYWAALTAVFFFLIVPMTKVTGMFTMIFLSVSLCCRYFEQVEQEDRNPLGQLPKDTPGSWWEKHKKWIGPSIFSLGSLGGVFLATFFIFWNFPSPVGSMAALVCYLFSGVTLIIFSDVAKRGYDAAVKGYEEEESAALSSGGEKKSLPEARSPAVPKDIPKVKYVKYVPDPVPIQESESKRLQYICRRNGITPATLKRNGFLLQVSMDEAFQNGGKIIRVDANGKTVEEFKEWKIFEIDISC